MRAILSLTKWQKMALKNFLFFFFLTLFLNGCSHKLTSTKQLDTLDERLAHLEKNLSHDISKNVAYELDAKLYEHDQNLKVSLQFCLERQRENFEYLKNELTALIKPDVFIVSNEDMTKQNAPIIVQKKVTSFKEKLVVGSVEKIHVYPSNLVMDARIDTGAETSSIDARDIKEFERDGKSWVRFTLVDRKTKAPHVIERKVVRIVKILQSSVDQGHEKRVVVTLKITIGDKKELSEFTLTNREHMQYPILIGRNALQDVIVVDVSEQYIAPLVVEQEKSFKK
ncbi:MAG: ATP-dependent zinc protease [Sulfurimonadaceae bacterium]|jgi:hypothetical protein|nr:ATP-dependent zinc protease [Sulfurimonadaceae bacterium]